MNKIKAIAFDVGGVILENGFEKLYYELKKHLSENFTYNYFDEIFVQRPEAVSLRSGFLPIDKYWKYVSKEIEQEHNVNILNIYTSIELTNMLIKGFKVNKQVVTLMKTLKDEKYKIIIMSNDFKEKEECFRKKFEYYDYVDTKIFSYQIGESKPSKAFFFKTLKFTKLKPNEIIFIDDRLENIEASKALGFQSIHFNIKNNLESEVRKFL